MYVHALGHVGIGPEPGISEHRPNSSWLLYSFRTRVSHRSAFRIDLRLRTLTGHGKEGIEVGEGLQANRQTPTAECTVYMTCILMCLSQPAFCFGAARMCICAVPINSFFSFLCSRHSLGYPVGKITPQHEPPPVFQPPKLSIPPCRGSPDLRLSVHRRS